MPVIFALFLIVVSSVNAQPAFLGVKPGDTSDSALSAISSRPEDRDTVWNDTIPSQIGDIQVRHVDAFGLEGAVIIRLDARRRVEALAWISTGTVNDHSAELVLAELTRIYGKPRSAGYDGWRFKSGVGRKCLLKYDSRLDYIAITVYRREPRQ